MSKFGKFIFFNKKLKALLTKENLLNMTKNCVEIEESLDDYQKSESIRESNCNLWDFIVELAEAQGYNLPEYQD